MCRFLLLKSALPIEMRNVLFSFAQMAKKSKAYDGDSQKDGWGIAWRENGTWNSWKSINPIWEDEREFYRFKKTQMCVLHARSASFPQHQNNILYNQPYVSGDYAYVFNGLLKGVTLSLPGDIGAQKIWSLLQTHLKTEDVTKSLQNSVSVLKSSSRLIQAVNIGLASADHIAAYSSYTIHPEYYTLHFVDTSEVKIISSEPIDGYHFTPHPSNSSLIL